MVRTEEQTERRILEILAKRGELNIKKIAKLAKMSSSTAAKYLMILEKAGKVTLREEKPYKEWRIVSKNAKNATIFKEA